MYSVSNSTKPCYAKRFAGLPQVSKVVWFGCCRCCRHRCDRRRHSHHQHIFLMWWWWWWLIDWLIQCTLIEWGAWWFAYTLSSAKPVDSFISLRRLVGLVVKASASRAEDLGFESRLRRDFPGLSHTSDLEIGTPVATLPGAWRYRVRVGTGRPGVSILWLGEVESLICNFCLSVATSTVVFADPWDTLAYC